MERQLTEGRPFGVLLRYALPVLGGNLFQLFYTLADTVIVGKTLGADALAAVGSTGIISYFVLCFVQGLTGGFGICLGQCCGAGDETGMRRSAAVSWTLSAVFTLLLTPLVCLLARPVLGWMQTPEDIFADAYAYLFVILLGTGATVFYNIISYMLRALGDSRTPLVFLVLSSLLNIGLDILFIVPFIWALRARHGRQCSASSSRRSSARSSGCGSIRCSALAGRTSRGAGSPRRAICASGFSWAFRCP